jgi:hypothetical protein
MESFDLRIEFYGLALYVPQGTERMHVLLPVHGAMADGKGRHFARLVYDTAYENPASTQLARTFKFVDVERRVLELLDLSDAPLDVTITSEIFDLGEIADGVDPALVTGPPTDPVMSRVTMNRGALTRYQLGALYNLAGPRRRMASRSEWTIRGIPGDTLALADFLSGPAGETPVPPLHPIGQTIHVTIYNALAADMPPEGDFNPGPAPHPSHHFHAYYAICKPKGGTSPGVPTEAGEEPVLITGDFPKPKQDESGGGLTCVQGQSHLAQPGGQ